MNTDFRFFPEQASTMAPRIEGLFWYITGVAIFFTLLIATGLLVFATRYRRRSEDFFPKPLVGSTALELTWTIIPLFLVLVMFGWGLSIYADYSRSPENALEVYVMGKQWMWHTQHPGGQREINALHIPVGQPVRLIMTSEDVIHDFFVPAFRVKMDVLPGKYSYLWFEATKAGTYDLFCGQYCGTDHSRMIGKVVVMERYDYERWLARSADRSLALQGRQLFQKLQCVTCHHPDAGNRAPILEGIYGKRVQMDDGTSVLADEAYLRESILRPNARVRMGWRRPSIMPAYDKQVSEDELIRLIAFLKGLRQGETPPLLQQSDPPAVEDEKKK